MYTFPKHASMNRATPMSKCLLVVRMLSKCPVQRERILVGPNCGAGTGKDRLLASTDALQAAWSSAAQEGFPVLPSRSRFNGTHLCSQRGQQDLRLRVQAAVRVEGHCAGQLV